MIIQIRIKEENDVVALIVCEKDLAARGFKRKSEDVWENGDIVLNKELKKELEEAHDSIIFKFL